MSKPLSFNINSSEEAVNLIPKVLNLVIKGLAAGSVVLTLGRDKRSNDQNKKMWAMLRDISEHVVWHGRKLSDESWKNIVSAEIEAQLILPGITVPFVAMGVSTKGQDKKWFSDMFEQLFSFGAEHGVIWSDPKIIAMEAQYKESIERAKLNQ